MELKCSLGFTEEDGRDLRKIIKDQELFIKEHERIMKAVFADNGDKGLLSRFNSYLDRADERETARLKRENERENHKSRRENLILGLLIFGVSVGGVLVALLSIYIVHFDATHPIPRPTHSQIQQYE